MEITLLIISNIVAPVITGFVTFLYTRRKYNSEVDSNVIKNMLESLTFFKSVNEESKKELKELQQKIDTLETEKDELKKEIGELRKQMLDLTMNICMNLTCTQRIRSKEECNTRYSD